MGQEAFWAGSRLQVEGEGNSLNKMITVIKVRLGQRDELCCGGAYKSRVFVIKGLPYSCDSVEPSPLYPWILCLSP